MSFETVPLWGLLLASIGLVLLALEVGRRVGQRRFGRGQPKLEVAGTLVGATMGLLAFMMGFTFNNAATRNENRKALVIEEVNAIDKTWLRAEFLADPHRAAIRALLREYVNLRVKAASPDLDIAQAVRQSEALHHKMWAVATDAGRQNGNSITTGLFIQALNEVFDVHLERLTVAARNRVPPTIWATLYVLMALGMLMIGIQIGQTGVRQFGIELALALTFSVVLYLIGDLDRPQEGLMSVSQQAMVELQGRLNAR